MECHLQSAVVIAWFGHITPEIYDAHWVSGTPSLAGYGNYRFYWALFGVQWSRSSLFFRYHRKILNFVVARLSHFSFGHYSSVIILLGPDIYVIICFRDPRHQLCRNGHCVIWTRFSDSKDAMKCVSNLKRFLSGKCACSWCLVRAISGLDEIRIIFGNLCLWLLFPNLFYQMETFPVARVVPVLRQINVDKYIARHTAHTYVSWPHVWHYQSASEK